MKKIELYKLIKKVLRKPYFVFKKKQMEKQGVFFRGEWDI